MNSNNLNKIKKTGFKTPDGYFDGLEQRILQGIKNEKDQTPISKNTGYTVPDDYFIMVEANIIDKLEFENNDPKVKSLSYKKSLYMISGIAAALLLFFAIFPLNDSNNDITIEMVESYFQDKNLDSYELAELLVDADLLNPDDIDIVPEIDDSELENYLLEHADIEQFMTE